jgi:DNA-binding MarR family transcriptional regulator
MGEDPDVFDVAGALRVSAGLLIRRVRQVQTDGDLTMSEIAALTRLDRGGATTPSALAKLEQISPQAIGATLGALAARGLVERRPHPDDGRSAVMSLTEAGQLTLRNRLNAQTEHLAHALSSGFTDGELRQLMAAIPLIERLAQRI